MTCTEDCEARLDELAEQCAWYAADLYFFVTRRVVEDLGEAGEKAVRQGLREWGLARAQAIRQRVEDAGAPVDLASYRKHYDLPMARAWKGENTDTPTCHASSITHCPFADRWRERGGERLGQMFCEEVDPALRHGFDPRLHFTASQYVLLGDPLCEQREEWEQQGAE